MYTLYRYNYDTCILYIAIIMIRVYFISYNYDTCILYIAIIIIMIGRYDVALPVHHTTWLLLLVLLACNRPCQLLRDPYRYMQGKKYIDNSMFDDTFKLFKCQHVLSSVNVSRDKHMTCINNRTLTPTCLGFLYSQSD